MEAEPSKAEPPKPKVRWFQFRLRTLLIAVTIFCVAGGGYVGRQAKIVRERQAVIRDVNGVTWAQNPDDSEIPLIRRWLGDHAFLTIWLNETMPDEWPREDIRRIAVAFPEARIDFGSPNADAARHSATQP